MKNLNKQSRLPIQSICWLFLVLGCTCFGGMWAAIDRLQRELVERRNLLTIDDQKSLMLAAAMIPAPKFLAFAAMVGYRVGGVWGAIGSSVFILLPGTLIVIAACVLTGAVSENPALVTVQRYVGLGVIGLLVGNAVRMFVGDRVDRDSILFGLLISLGIPVYVILYDGSLIMAACAGIALGSLTIRGDTRTGPADVE
ncbi:MAG: chromate transporter [Gammaproteobacteria bacterium]|nr:chromate transporter [Gammaproteobacteria bacterium]